MRHPVGVSPIFERLSPAPEQPRTPALFPVLRADPDLGRGIPADERAVAERLIVAPLIRVAEGPWDALRAAEAEPRLFGFYVLHGTLSREVRVDGRALPQILGPGDV